MISALVLSSFLAVPVDRVIDGDTFTVNIPGVPEVLGADLGVRITGIDTAELTSKTKCLKQRANVAKEALTLLIDDQLVDLHFCFRDKFYRINCSVMANRDIDVGNFMLDSSFAVPYSGGKKPKLKCTELADRVW